MIESGEQSIQPLTDSEFASFRRLIEEEIGIHLADGKRALLVARLSRRLRQGGFQSFHDYFRHVTEVDAEEKTRMFDAVCTNETQFFREAKHFRFLEEGVFPAWRRSAGAPIGGRTVRIWSAGCSSGEEPYSLAMTLLDQLPPAEGWKIEITATDISTRVLDQARRGMWRIERASQIPSAYLRRFMLRGTRSQEGWFQAGDEVRSVIRFGRLNLLRDPYPFTEPFHLIFCRNVLIYFSTESRHGAVERMLPHLHPAGYFFVGHSESLGRIPKGPRLIIPTVYAR